MAIGDKQWLVTKPAGTDLISDIDGYQSDNNYALQTILKNYRRIPSIYNSSDSEITIGPGEVTTYGSIYQFRANTASITCTDASMEASTWYYIYAVADDAAVTTFTAELVKYGDTPAGTNTRLISMCKTDADGDIISFKQTGNDYAYVVNPTLFYDSDLSTPTAGWNAIDISPYVPSALSTRASFIVAAGTSQYADLANDGSVSTSGGEFGPNRTVNLSQASVRPHVIQEWDILTADTIYAMASAAITIYVCGFTINKL